jgi:4-amino-4-deoxy-L-arabinose transferase-like glycosyltransferase
MGIAAMYPPLWMIGTTLMSEALLLPLMVAAVAAAIEQRRSVHRLRWAIIVGVLVGLLALTRANAAIVVLPLALAAWPRPLSLRNFSPAMALIVAAVLTVTPWTIRNEVVMHSFVPLTTQTGFLLAGTYNPASANDSANPFAWRPVFLDPGSEAYLRRNAGRLNELQLDRGLRKRAFSYIASHPLAVPKASFWNTVRMAGLSSSWNAESAAFVDLEGAHWLTSLDTVAFWLLAALALFGIVRSRAARWQPGFVIAVPALLYLTAVFANGEIRFRLPVDVFLILPAAAAATSVVCGRRVQYFRGRSTVRDAS